MAVPTHSADGGAPEFWQHGSASGTIETGNTWQQTTAWSFDTLTIDDPAASATDPVAAAHVCDIATAPPLFIVDDEIDDTEPERNDLTGIGIDYTEFVSAGMVQVTLQLDEIAAGGGTTVNPSVIFDIDGDGNADYGYFIVLDDGAGDEGHLAVVSLTLYDGSQDKSSIKLSGSTATAAISLSSAQAGIAQNPFDAGDTDTLLTLDLYLDEIVAAEAAKGNVISATDIRLVNAVVHPSDSPTSAPDEEILPDNFTLTLTDDLAETTEDTQVVIDFLANDSAQLTAQGIQLGQPGSGTAVLNADGTLTYTPDTRFTGVDTFGYEICWIDGNHYSAMITVTVTPDPTRNTAPLIQEPISFLAEENQTFAAALQAFDPDGDTLIWSITGGADADAFDIDPASGVLGFRAPPNFEAPGDADGDNAYHLTVRVSDGQTVASQDILVTVTDALDDNNNAPVITSPTGDPASMVLTLFSTDTVGRVLAMDPDGDTLEFLLFGEDADLFDLDPFTGDLSLVHLPQELPGSFDGDAIYELEVLVRDGHGASDTLALEMPLYLGA